MEFLRRNIALIKIQLGALTASQRLVVILLLVIMCGAIVQMVSYARERELVPLFRRDIPEDKLNRIVDQLEAWEEQYTTKGQRLLVPKSRQKKIIARLAYKELLPDDTSESWSFILEDSDAFVPDSVRENRNLVILQMALARSIVDGWPQVQDAEVFINKGSQRRLNNITPVASASVSINLVSGRSPSRKDASAIAAFVSGAVNRLKRENVQVVMNGKLVPVTASGDGLDNEYLEVKAKNEDYYRNKIINALPPGISAIVEVDVTLQTTDTQKHTRTIPVDKSLIEKRTESTREQRSQSTKEQQEPGLLANATTSSQTGTGTSQSDETEESEMVNEIIPGLEEIHEVTGKGGIKDITASVSIPLSWFVGIAKQESQADESPTPEAINLVTGREIPKLKQCVMRVVGLSGNEYEDCVFVDTYWAPGVTADSGALAGVAEASGAAGTPSIVGLAGQYGKHIAVSALALISLFMVLMMVRKASGPVQIEEEEAMMMPGKPPMDAMTPEESNFADADAANGLLSAMEVDESSVRSQQVLEQIRNMVQESPDDAAGLVSKWMSQES